MTSPLSKEQARELVDVFGNRYAEYLAARQYSPEGYEAKLEAINCTDARDALLAAIDSLIEALAEARVIISGKTFYCAGCEADALEKKPVVSDSPLDIAAIRARCEAATEEPWTLVEDSAGENTIRARGKIIAGVIATVRVRWVHEVQRIQQAANARFIAHARTDIPALCDALSTAIAERDREREIAQANEHLRATTHAELSASQERIRELEKTIREIGEFVELWYDGKDTAAGLAAQSSAILEKLGMLDSPSPDTQRDA